MRITEKAKWEDIDKRGMVLTGFVKCNNFLIRQIINATNPQTAMLYLLILSHRNNTNGQCFPSRKLLASEMGLSGDSVGKMINALYDYEFLKVNSGRQHVANNYYFPQEGFNEGYAADTARKRKKQFKKKPDNAKNKPVLLEPVDDAFDDDFDF